jgi:hypothetical protein
VKKQQVPTQNNYYQQLYEKYIFDKNIFQQIAKDLVKIKKANTFIHEIGIDGGSIVDLIYKLPVHDYDIRYSTLTKNGEKFSRECLCEKVKKSLDNLDLKVLNVNNIDLGNINETGVLNSLNFRYSKALVGNNCYTNTILLTDNKEFICCKKTFDALMNRMYVPNFFGYFDYSYGVNGKKDHHELLLEMIVRGTHYIVKRKLKCHEDFKNILEVYPSLKNEMINPERIVKIKFDTLVDFETHVKQVLKNTKITTLV